MDITAKLDLPDFEKWATEAQLMPGGAVQKAIDTTLLEISSPYTPWRTGQLEHSGPNGTVIGSGLIVYATPYAHRLYVHPEYNFNRLHHPLAGAEWVERAFAADGDKVITAAKAEIKTE